MEAATILITPNLRRLAGLVYPVGNQIRVAAVLLTILFAIRSAASEPPPYQFTTIAGRPGLRYADGTNQTIRLTYPSAITVQGDHTIFVADRLSCTIIRMAREGTNWVSTTIAGKPGMVGSADGVNGEAMFNAPAGIAVDANTNLFVADSMNNTIRRITPSGTNWVVTTWAGKAYLSGTSDGFWVTARFNTPLGLALDSAGNLYVADSGNCAIRKVTTSGSAGNVSTVAGTAGFGFTMPSAGSTDGIGTQARFRNPQGVAFANSTTMYVTDGGNNTIRKLVFSTGAWSVTTICGSAGQSGYDDGSNAQIRFRSPSGLAASFETNLWVMDSENSVLRRITKTGSDWVSSTPAGTVGLAGFADGTNSGCLFSLPKGICLDSQGILFVCDMMNSAIRTVEKSDSDYVVRTITGDCRIRGVDGFGPAASFFAPRGLKLGRDGALYVTDYRNHTIRRLKRQTGQWQTETLAGAQGALGGADGTNSGARFKFPSDLELDANGTIYVVDRDNCTIRKVTADGTNWVVKTIAGLAGYRGTADGTNDVARFTYPAGITMAPSGELYVADNLRIRKLSPVGADWAVTTLDLSGGALIFGEGLFAPDSETLFVVEPTGGVKKLSFTGTNWLVSVISGEPGARICRDSQGRFYITDLMRHVVRSVAESPTNWTASVLGGTLNVKGYAEGTGSEALFWNPSGIAVDAGGVLYVCDEGNDVIRVGHPLPSLNIAAAGQHAVLWWPASAGGFVPEVSEAPSSGSWEPLQGTCVTNGGWVFWTNSTPQSPSFFRLREPVIPP